MPRAAPSRHAPRRWSARDRLPSQKRQALPAGLLPDGWQARVGDDGLAVAFGTPQRCLSSAVARGGWGETGGFANLHVTDADRDALQAPAALVAAFADRRGLAADCVGMLTGASMRTLRVAGVDIEDARLTVLVTAGLANARRAGDAVDQRTLRCGPGAAGTINLALGTTLALTPAALAETLTTLTEAKAAVLDALGVTSPVSGATATGTGTDATAVFCAIDGAPLYYTGKHTRFGEGAARLVIDALTDAIEPDPRWTHVDG